MPTLSTPPASIETLADLLERLGNIPLQRIRWHPYPGTATEQDMLDYEAHTGRACELVDGVLVEKVMAWLESTLASRLIALLYNFVLAKNLGAVTGEKGTYRLFPGLVRIPDVAFTAWDRMPGRRLPTVRVPSMAPNLAVEILSEGNTDDEMKRKREDYFSNGVELVWIIDPEPRTVTVYTATDIFTQLSDSDVLDGGAVLPGFQIAVKEFFAELDRHG
jgi:Uma2 family endonuclease